MFIIFFALFLFSFIKISYHIDYINRALKIDCIGQQEIDLKYKKSYIYAHKKFSKVVNFFYHFDISEAENHDSFDLSIIFLMCYFDDYDSELISSKENLENSYQWYLSINNEKIDNIDTKKKNLEDELIFGKKNLRYGKLYCVKKNISKSSICGSSIPISLVQMHRKVDFEIRLHDDCI